MVVGAKDVGYEPLALDEIFELQCLIFCNTLIIKLIMISRMKQTNHCRDNVNAILFLMFVIVILVFLLLPNNRINGVNAGGPCSCDDMSSQVDSTLLKIE